jgi:lysophospholipase L1-like esterase
LAVSGVLVPASSAAAANGEPPDPPTALPARATANDLKWQPALDYDTNGCYNVPAIGPTPTGGMDPAYISYGLGHDYTTSSLYCRDKTDLDNTNAYSRQRCNQGWCVYLYDYYFEKDVSVENVIDAGGHTHDWEHIAVWVQNDQAKWVSASQHGKYVVKPASEVRWDTDPDTGVDTHPKLVYSKDGGFTHFFRFATAGDEPTENHYTPSWRRSTLVSYNGFPGTLRDQLFNHDFGAATIAIKEGKFAGNLESAIPTWSTLECTPNGVGGQTCTYVQTPVFAFDYNLDVGSPGDPPAPPPPPDDPPPAAPIKVMVVGDSMTQGAEGDWTWRYRLWEWFHDHGVKVDFVGPYTGTHSPDVAGPPVAPPVAGEPVPAPAPPSVNGGYATGSWPPPLFDSDHFAVWGRQAAQDKDLIYDQVAQFKPDYLLVGLGFNDMGWFVSGPEGTLGSIKTLVDRARAAKPDIKFALANVPQRTRIGGREDLPVNTTSYNDMLKNAIPSWSTPTSPVALVDWAGNYGCGLDSCPAAYDGLHPNALGEYQIARAFELTLHGSYRLGDVVPAVPADIPVRPTPVPGNVTAASVKSGIAVTWDAVYGAHGYTVRSRIVGANDWTESHVNTNRMDTTWTLDGWTWEYQVRTDNGDQQKSDWSGTVSAVAHPETAPPPVGMVTHATATGVDVVWGAPPGPYAATIDRYQVITWDKDTPGAWFGGTVTRAKSAHVDGLIPGHHYLVALVSWNAAGGGMPGVARPVTIGAGTPPAPTGLQVTSVDGTTVQLNWTGSPAAAGYRVWVRNINDGSVSSADENIIDGTSWGVAYLFPGVWNYEFCVTAINGAAESGKSNCVVAPRPPG